MSKKRKPRSGELLGSAEKEAERQNKYMSGMRKRSMPIRISFETLSSIYRYQHNIHMMDCIGMIPMEVMESVPDSTDMEFGDWYDFLKTSGLFDIYEEAV